MELKVFYVLNILETKDILQNLNKGNMKQKEKMAHSILLKQKTYHIIL